MIKSSKETYICKKGSSYEPYLVTKVTFFNKWTFTKNEIRMFGHHYEPFMDFGVEFYTEKYAKNVIDAYLKWSELSEEVKWIKYP